MTNYLKLLANNMRVYLLLLSILFLFVQNSNSQVIEQKIAEIMNEAGTPGIQISFSNGKRSNHFAQGIKKFGTEDTILMDTRFQAASLTKVIASYAFFRLMDRGLIELDTPLLSYYSYDRLTNTKNANKITARMVLTHRTGLLNWEGDVPSEKWRASPLSLQFYPGADYMYSGEGFYFLQETLEHITGKDFQQIIEEEVLTPLAMVKSNILWNDSLSNVSAYGHYEHNKPRKLGTYRKSNAAYTLYTTSSDYLSFVQQAIIEGKGLKQATHQLMLTQASEVKKDNIPHFEDKYVPTALGLRMQLNEQCTAYWHTGSNPGFRCFFITYPKSGESLVAFMNSDTAFPAMKKLMQLFLNPNQTFWAYDWRLGELD